MTTVATIHHLQIERVISKSFSGEKHAVFNKDGVWFCCQAWFTNGVPTFQSRGTGMTLEEASAVSIALQMAIDWVAEEKAKLEAVG